jgi:spermidine synthase
MIPWRQLGSTAIPGGDGEMRLFRRGGEFSIRVGPHELMNSRVHGSEKALAELACARIANRERARVLIGGLGMGFTLAAVLTNVGMGAAVEVAELVPAVVAWNRGPMAEINGPALDDPRVTIREGDVASLMRTRRGAWDAILLDVDNGPSALTARANEGLYGLAGLHAAHAALGPAGILAVWSADRVPEFTRRLAAAGFRVEEHPVRARGRSGGSRFLIWLAQKFAPKRGRT